MTRTLPTLVHVRPVYASCGWSPYVATFRGTPTYLDRSHCSQKKGSRHNLQHASWPIRGSVPSFSLEPANEARIVSQAPDGDQLLDLPGPYHWHATLEVPTCHIPLPNLPDQLSPLSPSGPARSPFNQVLAINPKCWVLKDLWPPRGLSTTRPSTVVYIYA
jgi:hypothetical protein